MEDVARLAISINSKDTLRATDSLNRLAKQGSKTERATDSLTKSTDKSASSFSLYNTQTLALTAGIYGLATATSTMVNKFILLENAQIGVKKTTGLAGAEFDKLDGNLQNMAKTMAGFELSGLYDISEAAGQLGIQGVKDITEFTRVISMVGLTTELSAKEAGTAFAKLSKQMGEPIENTEILASVFNELSNTTAATVGDLLTFSSRIAGAGKTVGLSTADIAGLSATLSDLGVNYEVGGSAISRSMMMMAADSKKFADAMGIDSLKFASMVENEPIEALSTLLKTMETLNASDSINLLKKVGLGGIEASGVLLKVSNSTGTLTENLKIANDEYETGTSMQKEYETASEGLQAQNTKLSASFDILSASVGSKFKEPILEVSKSLATMTNTIDDNLDSIIDASRNIGIAGGSLLTATVAVKGYNAASLTLGKITAMNATRMGAYGGAVATSTISMRVAKVASYGLATAMKAIPLVAVASAIYLIADAWMDAEKAAKEYQDTVDRNSKGFTGEGILADYKYEADVKKLVSAFNTMEAREKAHYATKGTAAEAYYKGLFDESVNTYNKIESEVVEISNRIFETTKKGRDADNEALKKSNVLLEEKIKLDKKQLELNAKLRDTHFSLVGSEYDVWQMNMSNSMAEMARSTSITNEELIKYYETLAKGAPKTDEEQLQRKADEVWFESQEDDLKLENEERENRNQLDKEWNELLEDNYMSMLDSQISLVESTNDWSTGLSGVGQDISNISKSMTKLRVDELKATKAQAKLDSKFTKDYDKYWDDTKKASSLKQNYIKDTAAIESKALTNQIDGYANLAGTMAQMYEEGSAANKNLLVAQTALSVVSGITAIANAMASGDGYTAAARGLAVAATLSSFGWEGGGGSGISASAQADIDIKELEDANKPILDRLDRQIELLEVLGGFGGTILTVSLEEAMAEYTKDLELAYIGAWLSTRGTSEDALWNVLEKAIEIGEPKATEEQIAEKDIIGILLGASEEDLVWFDVTEQELEDIINSYQQVTHDFTMSLLEDMQTLSSAADDFEGAFDEITGTDYYKDLGLAQAQAEVDALLESSNLSLSEYLKLQIDNITELEDFLTDENIALLLSTNADDIVSQQELIATLSEETQKTLDDGAIEALNYQDSIMLVADSMVEAQATFEDLTNSMDSTVESLQSTIDKLRGASVDDSYELDRYFESMAKTQSLIGTEDFNIYVESIQETQDLSEILYNIDAFDGVERDMQFAQLVAASQFEEMQIDVVTQIDLLKEQNSLISELLDVQQASLAELQSIEEAS